jgi:hypothetical protein
VTSNGSEQQFEQQRRRTTSDDATATGQIAAAKPRPTSPRSQNASAVSGLLRKARGVTASPHSAGFVVDVSGHTGP